MKLWSLGDLRRDGDVKGHHRGAEVDPVCRELGFVAVECGILRSLLGVIWLVLVCWLYGVVVVVLDIVAVPVVGW